MMGLNSILPGTGRWREAPEGVLLFAQRLRLAPPPITHIVLPPPKREEL